MLAETEKQLSAEEMRAMLRGFNDHEQFCSHLSIRNKEGVPVPYRTSPGGRKLNKAIRKQEQAGKPVRIVTLKASQVWMSSSVATQIFRRTPFFPGRRALVLADIQVHADLVFNYYQQYIHSYALNPWGAEWNAEMLLPPLVKDTEQHLRWANGSSILVATARNVDIARSAPFSWVQLSEAAFYPSLGGVMTGLMQRVPPLPSTGVIVETTANGQGGDFYDLWQLAASGRSGWLACFFGYWEHPENRMRPEALGYTSPAMFQASLTPSEQAERDQYGLDLEQLAWRRHKIETDCEGRLGRFQQEHPGNPTEAFQSSGRVIFDLAALSRMPVTAEPMRGRLEVIQVGLEKKIQFLEHAYGELTIFKMPQPGRHYIIGADHAEGIDPTAKDGKSDPDYCSADVLDADTGEQVAHIRERWEPRPWAEQVYWLARWYNWAFITPEQKAVGKAMIGHLLDLGYPVELIYSTERDPSDRRPALLQELGWDTNTVFRPILISALDTAIRERAITIHDQLTLSECRAFVRKPNGREEGLQHDDCVFSLALAVVGLPKARKAFAYREEAERDRERKWIPTRYGPRARQDDDED